MSTRPGPLEAPAGALAVVIDDYALAAAPGLDRDLAREGALVMRAFGGLPNPNLLRRYRGVAVVGGPDRTGLLSRLERATATLGAPVVALLPRGVAPAEELRAPGVVDLVSPGARGLARRILLMASVPVVSGPRAPAQPGSAAAPREGLDRPPPRSGGGSLVAIASSTGGTWVLGSMLRDLPHEGRAVLVAQHIDADFAAYLAEWLHGASGWRTVVVSHPVLVEDGVAYLPAGGCDLVLEGAAVRAASASSRFVPCADRLLASAAARGPATTGVILSGMGSDGAEGLAAIALRGGRVLCQAPASAVVPSMPEAALRRTPGALALAPDALSAACAAPHGDDGRTAATARR
jgi:two-component system, chemotaxis family, protein-glutamate methylesterase/glutaminase